MTAKEWFEKAQAENFAIGAFNADNLDIFKAICVAAQRKKSPVMVEFSSGEVEYFGLANIVEIIFFHDNSNPLHCKNILHLEEITFFKLSSL